MLKRFIRTYATRNTHLISSTLAPVQLNEVDLQAIDSVVKNIPVKQSARSPEKIYRTKAKSEYIEKKVEVVKRIFSVDENNHVSMEPPSDMNNPYFDVHSKTVRDSKGKIIKEGTKRLSVTKLLTKRWCELSQLYDIYSRLPIFEHRQVKAGKLEHEKLEVSIHGIDESVEGFMDSYEWEMVEDDFHKLAENWFQCMNRLTTLFVRGEAREILCHGFLDSRTGNLIESEVKDDRDILVSGIIDHVIIFHTNPSKPKALCPELREANNFDLKLILANLRELTAIEEDLHISLSDVKTRPRKTIPNHASVVHASKLQVMYYRNFLETLGKSPIVTYRKLLLNASRRGFNIDDPINISNLIYFMETDPCIKPDLERIMRGEPIGFSPFDIQSSDSKNEVYDLSSYADLTIDTATLEKYGHFYQEWVNPPTLRYFAARLAQLYHELYPMLSNQLMIEYYTGDTNFHTERFQYDAALLEHECHDSAMFWFGQRAVEPIAPTEKNMITFCKYCDFHDVCSWRSKSSDTFKQLGSELIKVAKL